MKSVEDRLRELPRIAEESGLEADEQLRRRIMRAAQSKSRPTAVFVLRRLAPVMAALVILVGAAAFAVPALSRPAGPRPTEVPLIESFSAGSSAPAGEKLALDVPKGSITIRSSSNASYRSIWAKASGGNFPLVGVKGRYYRLLTSPASVSDALLGSALGTVDTFTDEPDLAGKNGIVSNVVEAGETVYAVQGMSGAVAAARVDGKTRLFQRVTYAGNALIGGESLSDTLRADQAVAMELSGVGAIRDTAVVNRLLSVLIANASRASGGGETNQALLIEMKNGVVLQMAVKGDKLIACGTWSCPEFFDAFQEAMQ